MRRSLGVAIAAIGCSAALVAVTATQAASDSDPPASGHFTLVEHAKTDTVIDNQPSFFDGVEGMLVDERLDQWKSWARWHAISSLASYLSSAFVDENFDFYGRVLNGTPALKARWKRGVSFVESAMGEAVGKLYVARHFPPAAKERMDNLVANLLAAYRQSISTLTWMSESTRAEALDKLSAFRPKIGYPVKWRDYSGLRLPDGSLVDAVLA